METHAAPSAPTEEPLVQPNDSRRWFSRKNLPAWIGKISREVFTIVFSVMLALILNELRSIQKEKAESVKILRAIEKELEENLNQTSTAAEYRQHMLTNWDETIREYNGIQLRGAYVVSSAWEIAKNRNVVSAIDVQLSIRLTQIYEWQQRYNSLQQTTLHILHEENVRPATNGPPNHRGYYSMMEDYGTHETVLKDLYENTLPLVRQEIKRLDG
jgi:fumarate reductase subunit C